MILFVGRILLICVCVMGRLCCLKKVIGAQSLFVGRRCALFHDFLRCLSRIEFVCAQYILMCPLLFGCCPLVAGCVKSRMGCYVSFEMWLCC